MTNRTAPCQRCGNTFTHKGGRGRLPKYCSPDCEPRCTTTGCTYRVLARGLCSSHYGQWHRDKYGRKQTTYEHNCIHCGTNWTSTRLRSIYCEDCCSQNQWDRQRRMPIPHPNPTPFSLIPPQHPVRQPPPQPTHVWYAGRCGWCDTPFVSRQPQSRYCTPRCGKQAAKKRRRALKRGATIAEPFSDSYIYQRDDWVCQICGDKTRPDYNYLHPLAPTIDHIVPLSRGGNHTKRNTQTSHRRCNSEKSDGTAPGGDQLRLVG